MSTATRLERTWVIPEAHEDLMQRYVPPSVLVNEHNEVVHTFGDARKILLQPGGRMTLDVTKMVSREMGTALGAGLVQLKSGKGPIVFNDVISETTDGVQSYKVILEKFPKSIDKIYLIIFEKNEAPVRIDTGDHIEIEVDPDDVTAERIRLLERELQYTKNNLQSAVEELETSNEELQSTNEELVASNEELQSTNEELHSVNEELHTVNVEHQRKIDELMQITADMDSLLKNSHVGILFLDTKLRIRRFTPPVQNVFHIIEQDVGRPIQHLAHKLIDVNLLDVINSAVMDNQRIELRAHINGGGAMSDSL
ncbi:MAG: PAS domain-containing protein [Planctomycetaceae bacterium]